MDLIEKSEEAGVFAVDMALELRVMGGSQVSRAIITDLLAQLYILHHLRS